MKGALQWSPALANGALRAFLEMRDAGPMTVSPTHLECGLVGALHRAELLAAFANVVPFEASPDGTQALTVRQIGGAAEVIESAPPATALGYRAVHGAVFVALAQARVTRGRTALLPPLLDVQALETRGTLAQRVGELVFLEQKMGVQVPGGSLYDVATAAHAADLVMDGKALDLETTERLKLLAGRMPREGWGGLMLATGAGVVGLAGMWLLRKGGA